MPIGIGGYFLKLSSRSLRIFVTGYITQPFSTMTLRSSFQIRQQIHDLWNWQPLRVAYIFSCHIRCTFQFRHFTAWRRSAT